MRRALRVFSRCRAFYALRRVSAFGAQPSRFREQHSRRCAGRSPRISEVRRGCQRSTIDRSAAARRHNVYFVSTSGLLVSYMPLASTRCVVLHPVLPDLLLDLRRAPETRLALDKEPWQSWSEAALHAQCWLVGRRKYTQRVVFVACTSSYDSCINFPRTQHSAAALTGCTAAALTSLLRYAPSLL